MNIAGSKVLVTGGGRGIGRWLVEGFVRDGASVGVFERDLDLCSELRTAFRESVGVWHCDVADAEAVDRAVHQAADDGFEPEVLVNNAGIIHSEPLVNLSIRGDRAHSRDTWRRVLAADLDSVFYVTSRVVDQMIARRCKGVIISISSVSAAGNPGQSAYSAAKAGVNALTSTWAKELGVLGLRFAAIAPGFLDTDSTRTALSEAILTKLQQQIPLRRLGAPEAIYQSARHIVENDYITGTVLEVDGGLSL
ncbi:MAG: SDR family oxidoreductase [Nitrospirae bacterium]|nr:SDR family oxidoreductase [Nitrospirota bacterium]